MWKPIWGHCVAGKQLFKWCRNLSAHSVLQGCSCLSNVKPICRDCVAGVRLFKRCQNLSAGTVLQGCSCLSGVETYLPALWCRGAGCLSSVGTYLPGTVLQGCRLFKRGSEPTSLALLSRVTGCLSSVSFYLLSRLNGQNWIYCSTSILGQIRWSLGTCNCFCLGVPSFFVWERSIQLECQQVSLARLFYLTRRVCILSQLTQSESSKLFDANSKKNLNAVRHIFNSFASCRCLLKNILHWALKETNYRSISDEYRCDFTVIYSLFGLE